MSKQVPNIPDEPGMPATVRDTMRALGYMHESELEIATSTSPRSRARWKSPRGVMFGNEKYYPLSEVKRHLDARAETYGQDEQAIL